MTSSGAKHMQSTAVYSYDQTGLNNVPRMQRFEHKLHFRKECSCGLCMLAQRWACVWGWGGGGEGGERENRRKEKR